MSDTTDRVLYDGPPIRARMAAYLLLGIGGLVLSPIGLLHRAWWLLVLAVPLLLAGLVLVGTHLRIVVAPGMDDDNDGDGDDDEMDEAIRVTNSLFGLRLRQRRYPLSDVAGLELQRVAGTERERPSDTWYLRLQLGAKTYVIGRYDSRQNALVARYAVGQALQIGPRAQAAAGVKVATPHRSPGPIGQ